MPKPKIRTALRPRKRWAESVEVPRWLAAAGIITIGLLLLLARLSDPSGNVQTPGYGAILYMAGVVAVAAAILYARRDRR